VTRRFTLVEEALREMRLPVVPVDDADVVEARRHRTVSHLQALQARVVVRRQIMGSWRKRLLVAAAVFVPSVALAATWVTLKAPFSERREDGAAESRSPSTESAPSPAKRATAIPFESLPQFESPPQEEGQKEAHGTGAVVREPSGPVKASSHASTSPLRAFAAAGTGARDSDGSTLAAENALMQAAMAAVREGDDTRAVGLLGGLLSRYPKSPLSQNAQVERFRAMARLGEGRAAARLARLYLGEHPDGMARDEARRMGVEGLPASSDAPRR
jgi:hypothetical protein